MKRSSLVIPLAFLLVACGPTTPAISSESSSSSSSISYDLPDAPNGSLGDNAITLGKTALRFVEKAEGGYSVEYVYEGVTAYKAESPVTINVRSDSSGILATYDEDTYTRTYSDVEQTSFGYIGRADVSTEEGSRLAVTDAYFVPEGSNSFAFERTVEVLERGGEDAGFQSEMLITNAEGSSNYEDFTYFIPAIIYKDTSEMRSGSIASNLNLTGKVMVKETRTGMPLSFIRQNSGYSIGLYHFEPEISVNGDIGGGANGEISEKFEYGSVGFQITPYVGVDFCYPSSEGPNTYDSGQGWAKRYHPLEKGFAHTYKAGIILRNEASYNDAMVATYKEAFRSQEIIYPQVDMEQIYEDNLYLFGQEYRTFGTNDVYGGLPWSLTLPDGSVDQGYASQSGFVGQQAAAAYQMLRYGRSHGDSDFINKGLRSLDFWTSRTIMGNYFPIIWWDPGNGIAGGTRRDYPTFLRCMVDAAEGILDGYLMEKGLGIEHPQWLDAITKIADNLTAVQNENGSFNRAYNLNGTVCTDTSNAAYQGKSELNTPVAVRFLGKMYELTGDEKYKTSALEAAEYSYQELYLNKGKYVGGTPDNPNTVDKEAAVYAMYCFQAAYELSGDEKYLAAAEHASVSAMSWVYVYDFAVPSQISNREINTFEDGGVIGFSFIATGHSSADNYAAYIFFALYRMYLETGDDFYRSAALLIENATKLSNDYDGRMGFKYRALGPEATTVADFNFSSVGTWLPWSGIANIEPIIQFKSCFGTYSIESLTMSEEEQINALEAYGLGGKTISNI